VRVIAPKPRARPLHGAHTRRDHTDANAAREGRRAGAEYPPAARDWFRDDPLRLPGSRESCYPSKLTQSNRDLTKSDTPAAEQRQREAREAVAARLPWKRPELQTLAIDETRFSTYPEADGFDFPNTGS